MCQDKCQHVARHVPVVAMEPASPFTMSGSARAAARPCTKDPTHLRNGCQWLPSKHQKVPEGTRSCQRVSPSDQAASWLHSCKAGSTVLKESVQVHQLLSLEDLTALEDFSCSSAGRLAQVQCLSEQPGCELQPRTHTHDKLGLFSHHLQSSQATPQPFPQEGGMSRVRAVCLSCCAFVAQRPAVAGASSRPQATSRPAVQQEVPSPLPAPNLQPAHSCHIFPFTLPACGCHIAALTLADGCTTAPHLSLQSGCACCASPAAPLHAPPAAPPLQQEAPARDVASPGPDGASATPPWSGSDPSPAASCLQHACRETSFQGTSLAELTTRVLAEPTIARNKLSTARLQAETGLLRARVWPLAASTTSLAALCPQPACSHGRAAQGMSRTYGSQLYH